MYIMPYQDLLPPQLTSCGDTQSACMFCYYLRYYYLLWHWRERGMVVRAVVIHARSAFPQWEFKE